MARRVSASAVRLFWRGVQAHTSCINWSECANRLVDLGVLRKEQKRFLGVVPYEAYPAQDASARFWIKQHLRSVVLGGEAPDGHTAALLSLVRACDLLGRIFTRDELKTARRQSEALRRGEAIGEAVQQAIETIEAATSAAIMAATFT
jgi:golgi phosphoprotein 3